MAILRAEGLKLDVGSMFKLISGYWRGVEKRQPSSMGNMFSGGGGDVVDEALVLPPPLFLSGCYFVG